MGDLTRNFSKAEFACPCCGRVQCDMAMVYGLQAIRDEAGVPFSPNSAFRCVKYNAEVGGGTESQHPHGRASDITIPGMSVGEMYDLAVQVPVFLHGGIGAYMTKGFIHVDCRGVRARWGAVSF